MLSHYRYSSHLKEKQEFKPLYKQSLKQWRPLWDFQESLLNWKWKESTSAKSGLPAVKLLKPEPLQKGHSAGTQLKKPVAD